MERRSLVFMLVVYYVTCITPLSASTKISGLHFVEPSDLSQILSERCALLGVPPYHDNVTVPGLLNSLQRIYEHDPGVFVGQFRATVDQSSGTRPSRTLAFSTNQSNLVFYKRQVQDRSCLLQPPNAVHRAQPYNGDLSVDGLVRFVNDGCGAFRTAQGTLTRAGVHHERILSNLYRLSRGEDGEACQRIKMPDTSFFVREYLLRSRPVVIEGAINDWPARTKWTSEFLLERYGKNNVHVKLTPDGSFEGVESAELWSGYHENRIPVSVRSQLQFPDLVVVRPASAEMKFSKFLDLTLAKNKSYSAYLEYSSIPYYMPELEEDLEELPFLGGLLHRHHLNMWLSDGGTLGKLHFDPYDNLLCQVKNICMYF